MDPEKVLILLVLIYIGARIAFNYLPALAKADASNKAVAASKVDANAVDAASNKADAAVSNQLNFQTPATTIMEKIVDLHHDLMFFIIVVVVFVS